MISIDEVLAAIKDRIKDADQEARIRELYAKTQTAFQAGRAQAVEAALRSDRAKLRREFDRAMEVVNSDTGLT